MARVERHVAQGQIPVQQAQLIDPGSFPADTSSAEALKAGADVANVFAELAIRKRNAQDRIGITNVNALMDEVQLEYEKQIIGKPLTEHAAIRQKIIANAKARANQELLTPDARETADNNFRIKAERFASETELANVQATHEVALIKTSEGYMKALTEGDIEDIKEAEGLLDSQLKNIPAVDAAKYKASLDKNAVKAMEDRAVSDVHEALEAENFGIARELAKNPLIPEPKQTSLRGIIKTAETAIDVKAKEARKELIDKTTSDTIREYFQKELTVAELNSRHEQGLIKDSEFKTMMTDLTKTAPDNSDLIAKGRIRRALAKRDEGAITNSEAMKTILQNYSRLDVIDREDVVVDLEEVEARSVATAKSNAYKDGITLMSRQFIGIEDQGQLRLLLDVKGLTDKEKKRINARWVAEMDNRDLYEEAVKQRFRDMRRKDITDGDEYRRQALGIMLQYRRRKDLALDDLLREVGTEQQSQLSGIAVRPIESMTTDEKQKELERIRALKKLAR